MRPHPVPEVRSVKGTIVDRCLHISFGGGYDAHSADADYPRVNNPSGDPAAPNARSQFETTIAKNGSTVLVAYVDTRAVALGNLKHGISISRSVDHGKTFNKLVSATGGSSLPNTSDGDQADPILVVNPATGYFYLFCNRFPEGPGFQVFRSTDNGVSFSLHGNAVAAANTEMDKPHAAIDPYTGTGNGYLYAAGVQDAEGGSAPTRGIYFARSTNGGSTWSIPTLIAMARQSTVPQGVQGEVHGAWVVVGADHCVYVFWLDMSLGPLDPVANPDGKYFIKMRKSTDNGATFGTAVDVVELTDTATAFGQKGDMSLVRKIAGINQFFLTEAFPQAVANPKTPNQLFVTFAAKGYFTADKADAYLAVSNNGGSSWTTSPSFWNGQQVPTGWKIAARVNHDAGSADQWRPAMAINPDGRKLFIGYYDRRDNLDANYQPLNTDVHVYGSYFNISPSAATWAADIKLTDTAFLPVFNYRNNPDNELDLKDGYWGSYDGITADHDFFYYSYSHHTDAVFTTSGPNVRLAKFFAPEKYEIVDLGSFGGNYSDGNGLNNSGQATGYAEGNYTTWDGFPAQKGYLYSAGTLIDMVSPGGSGYQTYMKYYGNAINDSAVIAGWVNYSDYYHTPFRWTQAGSYAYLGYAPNSSLTYALAINNAGAVAGYGITSSGLNRGTYWAAGSATAVDLQGFQGSALGESLAYGVNAQNRVVGKSKYRIVTEASTNIYWHGFNLLNPAVGNPIVSALDIGTYSTVTEDSSEARAINATGFVVGGSGPNTSSYTPFIKAPGTAKNVGFTSLGQMQGGNHALALSVNANNRVVGYGNSTWGTIAFVKPEGGNNIIPLGWVLTSGDQGAWQLITAEGVNDNRQVTGWGYHNGVARAYLMSPVP